MKKFFIFCLILPLFFSHISSALAQHDLLTVKPDNSNGDQCGFVMTIANHNSLGKNIDEVLLTITSTTGNPIFLDIPAFPHWSAPNFTDQVADIISDNTGIAPNTTLNGLSFVYTIDANYIEPPIPVTINWVTKSSGQGLDSGSISPICTEFQSFTTLDTAKVTTSQSGQDPCFTFTMLNRNLQGGTNGLNIDIYSVSFQIENASGATMRPSKITPATGWVTDSVTASTAYFHTLTNPITTTNPVGGWTVCLRAGTSITKYNFVWSAFTDADQLIDRDTLFNISNTSTGTATESDSLSAKSSSGCLYNVTLKNYHLTNQLPPSRIVRLVFRSNTSGVTFSAAPSAPTNWTKTVTNDSIVFLAPKLADGIPDGIVSSNQFSFSVNNPTTNNFTIGWESDQAGNTFPTQYTFLSSGSITTKCTTAPLAADSAFNKPGLGECDYKLTVNNSHNTPSTPQSNLSSLSISIPSNAGLLIGTTGPVGWNWSNSSNVITCKPALSSDNMPSGTSQDFLYSFVPNVPGTNVSATWTTIDDQAKTTGTGTFTINCSPIVNICDTVVEGSSFNDDSCIKIIRINNRKSVAISQLVLSSTNGWTIVSGDTPTGWTKLAVGKNQLNYTSIDGLAAGSHQDFQIQFANYYPDTAAVPPPNNFFVNWLSTDVNGLTCRDSLTVTPGCLARPFHVTQGSVAKQTVNSEISNFTVVPNPTHGKADISFDVNAYGYVSLTILDVLGNRVASISSKMMQQGTYHFPYQMNSLADGTYYIRMQTSFGVITRKLVLTK